MPYATTVFLGSWQPLECIPWETDFDTKIDKLKQILHCLINDLKQTAEQPESNIAAADVFTLAYFVTVSNFATTVACFNNQHRHNIPLICVVAQA